MREPGVDVGDRAEQAARVHTPPNPGKIASLLAAARKLGLDDVASGAGSLEGATIIVESDGGSAVRWSVVDSRTPPSGFASYGLTVEAWTALRFGDLSQGDLVAYGGHRYTVSAVWNGQRHVATLTEIGIST